MQNQNSKPSLGSSMLSFTPLASSSSGNAYIVDDGQTRLLLEAGLKIKQLRRLSGFSLGRIDGCLISHEHGDHACGVHDIMRAGIDCYMSSGTMQALGASGHRIPLLCEHGKQFKVGTISVVPFAVIHDAAEPMGFLIATQASDKLVFATDTHYIQPRFQGLTHIAVECNFGADLLRQNTDAGLVHPDVAKRLWARHMSIAEVRRFLQAQDLRTVQEIHLLHLSDHNSDAESFQAEIERLTGKPVYVAR